ncbi:MAG: TlpA family protein disulfide reductase, partial [Deltaproteobacteria bacterium]|nr:TlpA family protein disulfide reductase [Deltaproteobacteria bacterium]
MFLKLFSFSLLLLVGLVVPATAASLPTDRFPDLPLAGTGLDDATTPSATLRELPFQVLVVEIFSMYCPHCQREAPAVNELHDILKARYPLGQVGLVGIGVGNTAYEVNIFRKKFTIE